MESSESTTQRYFSSETMDPCVHCGFCLPTCASYRVLGTEMDSPRGRIHLLRAINNNEIEMDSTVAYHFDTCLGCFACVTACPSGVRYDELIEATRPKLNNESLRDPCQNLFRKVLLQILPYPKRLRAILCTLRDYSGSNIQKLLRHIGLTKVLGKQLEAMESLMPPLSAASFTDDFEQFNPAKAKCRGRVGLILGCVQRCFDPDVNQATISVLQANGFEVVIPKKQGCCGAVTHHQGQIHQTITLGRELVKSFEKLNKPNQIIPEGSIDAVLVAASGCGHTMKAYKRLLGEENDFTMPVFDVHEFLAKEGLITSFIESLSPLQPTDGNSIETSEPLHVAFHDACHMIHGQKISKEPRELLKTIPNLLISEVEEVGLCCGSAGIYNLVQPNEAEELGTRVANQLLQQGGGALLQKLSAMEER